MEKIYKNTKNYKKKLKNYKKKIFKTILHLLMSMINAVVQLVCMYLTMAISIYLPAKEKTNTINSKNIFEFLLLKTISCKFLKLFFMTKNPL